MVDGTFLEGAGSAPFQGKAVVGADRRQGAEAGDKRFSPARPAGEIVRLDGSEGDYRRRSLEVAIDLDRRSPAGPSQTYHVAPVAPVDDQAGADPLEEGAEDFLELPLSRRGVAACRYGGEDVRPLPVDVQSLHQPGRGSRALRVVDNHDRLAARDRNRPTRRQFASTEGTHPGGRRESGNRPAVGKDDPLGGHLAAPLPTPDIYGCTHLLLPVR
jgi:hypothetical protein